MCVGKATNTPNYSSPEVGGSGPVTQTQRAQQLFTQDVLGRGGPLGAANRVLRGAPAMPGGDLDALMAQFDQQQAGKKNGIDTSQATSLATAAAQGTAVNASDGGDASNPLSSLLGGGQAGGGMGQMLGQLMQSLMPMIMKAIMSFI